MFLTAVHLTFVWGSAYPTGLYRVSMAMPVQHFVNPGQLVQAVSCTQKHKKTHVTLTFGLWPWYSISF